MQALPGWSRVNDSSPVSTSSLRFRHVRGGSLAFVSPIRHLTRSRRAVSRDAHHPGSLPEQLKVVWSLPCRPAPRGRPSSVVQQGCIELAANLHHGLLSAPSWRTALRVRVRVTGRLDTGVRTTYGSRPRPSSCPHFPVPRSAPRSQISTRRSTRAHRSPAAGERAADCAA